VERESKVNVLLVFANPLRTQPLRLDAEAREIQHALERSQYRDNIAIKTLPATTIRDLRRALLDKTYQIIHISGHGSRTGLLLADEYGGQYIVDPPTLVELFQRYPIECVLLNACYSSHQGRLLSSVVPFTIAMEGPITDRSAIAFATGFYDALGAGHPIDFAYKEGILSIKTEVSPQARLPKLIKKGTILDGNEEFEPTQQDSSTERSYIKAGKFLVGFAIDLSGSMDGSIRNEDDASISRLGSLDQSLGELVSYARASLKESRSRNIEASLDLFVYGFGLRTMPVCDLLSLIKAAREIITDDVIKSYTERVEQETRAKFKGYEGTGELLKSFGLEGLLSLGSSVAKQVGKNKVAKQLLRDMRPQIEARAKCIGDTTLSLEEIAQTWESSKVTLDNIKDLIFGNTPAEEVLAALVDRFQRELQRREEKTQSILFLVSDGKFTNIDISPFIERFQAMGVTIVSCFISSLDIANPRMLLNTADPQWGPEARLMFDLSSTMGDLPEVRRYLLDRGWMIYPRPKLFVQLNHSDVLKEFVRVTLSMLEDSEASRTLPKGW
jgi:hypothetical protein